MLAPPNADRDRRPRLLGDSIADLAAELSRVVSRPDYTKWLAQVRKTGGCARPVRLAGKVETFDLKSGELLHLFDTDHTESGAIFTPCNNRRSGVCPPCSEVYRADTYQLIRAGLSGGKGVPETVTEHPRFFVTLTPPSFGPVHSCVTKAGKVQSCHARRDAGTCEHGRPLSCTARHDDEDPVLGQPLCPACYDYTAHVLWHAHAGELWRRFITGIYRAMARRVGISERRLRKEIRVSYAKVAEYQRRGAVHFHAIIRLDDNDESIAPPNLPGEFLADAITTSAGNACLAVDYAATGRHVLTFGAQVDIRPVHADEQADDAITEQAVAGYIAKYATKGAESAGTIDRRIRDEHDLAHLPITEHARTLIATCWELGGLAELEDLNLRKWAHMLGFRGHFSTKARRYSTTLGALRQTRADYRDEANRQRLGLPDPDTTLVVRHWRVAGIGHDNRAERLLAQLIADTRRQVATITHQEGRS